MFGWAAAKADCKRPANNIATNLVTKKSAHAFKARNAASGNPFGNEDVTLIIKAGVVRVNEFPIYPFIGLTAEFVPICSHLLAPVVIVGEVDDLVIFIEQS